MVVFNEAYVVCRDRCWMHWPPNLSKVGMDKMWH